jgi:hypothetical protein
MLAFGLSWSDPDVWRDVILLGAAAAMTAPRKFRGFANRTWREGLGGRRPARAARRAGRGDRPPVHHRILPRRDARHVALARHRVGVRLARPGVAIGVLIFAMVRVPVSNAEFLAVVLGGIAFASGLAGYL